MSTREMVQSIIDHMNEEELKALFVVLNRRIPDEKPETNIRDQVDAVCGILHEYANPDLIPFESEEPWAEAAAEKERRILEEMKNEDA